MKPYQYHLINACIAGSLVTLGSLSSLLSGDFTYKNLFVGLLFGIVSGSIIFLNKFNDWFNTQDPDCKKLSLFNFI